MSYVPPSAGVSPSWAGVPAYGAPTGVLVASWSEGLEQWVPVGGSDHCSTGTPSVVLAQFFASPMGIAPPALGEVFALHDHVQAYRPPQFTVHASWLGADSYGAPSGAFLRASWDNSMAIVSPDGFDQSGVAQPSIYGTQFLQPLGWDAFSAEGKHYVLFPFQYHFPQWTLDASWVGKGVYAPPLSTAVNAAWLLPSETKQLSLTGWSGLEFGWHTAELRLARVLPAGIASPPIDKPSLRNAGAPLGPSGFVAQAFGRPTIFNWLQYLPVPGLSAQQFGSAFVQGGVHLVSVNGGNQSLYGTALLVNTKANQAAKPQGIAAPAVPKPAVSPQIAWPQGVLGTAIGFPVVHFPPQPAGWQSSTFGYATVEYKTKVIRAEGIDAFSTGFPTVRDLAQKVLHKSQLTAGVFGDIAVRNQNTKVRVGGFDALETSRWAEARNTRRHVEAEAIANGSYGDALVRNKTPSLHPVGIPSAQLGMAGIGYRVRVLLPSGAIPPYPMTGLPSLWQTPSLAPNGIAAPALPAPFVWPRVRSVEQLGWVSTRFGEGTGADFRWRKVVAEGNGIGGASYGNHSISHSMRQTSHLGRDWLELGNAWVSHGTRLLNLIEQGIEYPYMSNHRVGYTRQIAPYGFEGTKWLTTIVPEAQDVCPKTFGSIYGWPKVEHHKRYLRPIGITTCPEPHQHWGTAHAWNKRQIVTQVEDQQSELWPLPWSKWTLIENRNRPMLAVGLVATRYGRANVENGARQVSPSSIAASALPEWQPTGMVSNRVRRVLLDGLEAPNISRWAVAWNKAVPIKPLGIVATLSGNAILENTRRYRKTEGFQDSAFGYPMIADRVRELTFEQRYGIHPPVLPLPDVRLHTRYVEPTGMDSPQSSVLHILESRFNRVVTKWTQQNDLFGWPALKNLTPELPARGVATDVWGDTSVRLQWRPVTTDGMSMELFGRALIADRTRTVKPPGKNFMAVSDKVTVRRIGTQPVVTQYIDLRVFVDSEDGAFVEALQGHGIEPPVQQVGAPNLMKGYIYADRPADSMIFGRPYVTANTIRVEPGYWDFQMGVPVVSLKHRSLAVKTIGQLVADGSPTSAKPQDMGSWGKPSISPHTIYAVLEAPPQAVRNHVMNPSILRAVSDGADFGMPRVSQYLGAIQPRSVTFTYDPFGMAQIWSTKRHVFAEGFNAGRMGWPVIPGPQTIVVEEPAGAPDLGFPALAFPPGDAMVKPAGFSASAFGRPIAEGRNRKVFPNGWLAQDMGRSSGYGDNMPNSLHVGPPNLHQQDGFDALSVGTHWVSHHVRELVTQGHDSFICDYELERFEQRMRVKNADDKWRGRQIITAAGVQNETVLGHNFVRSGRHYIRPDGNSDQHRKGVPL